MIRFTRAALIVFIVGLFSFATLGTSLAARHAATEKLVVRINATPTSSIVWGSVKITYAAAGKTHTVGVCKTSSCTFHPPATATVTLKETPKDSASWPFKNWTVKAGGKTKTYTAAKISFKMNSSAATATATYRLPD